MIYNPKVNMLRTTIRQARQLGLDPVARVFVTGRDIMASDDEMRQAFIREEDDGTE